MSYYNGPPQGYPPQGHSPYPPQQGNYPPPGGPPPFQQQGYGPPPGQQQGGWGGPPPHHQGSSPYPPQGAPSQFPPPGGQYNAPPSEYGGPPQGQYGGAPPAPPAPPTLGYGQMPQIDMSRAADDLRKSMKGFGTDEKLLIQTLASLDAVQIAAVKQAFHQRHRRDLMKDVHSETSGYFRDGLMAICRGPLEQDCHTAHDAIAGLGTKESALNEVLLGRSNADLQAIKAQYHRMYHKTLESDVKGDLSLKTERLFDMVLACRRAEESTPVWPQEVDRDVGELYRATEGKVGADQVAVCSIFSARSDGQLRAIAIAYHQKYHRELEHVISKEFSGHMKDALLFMLRKAVDPAKHDADQLEDSMKGMGTKDTALVRRVVAIHWDRQRLDGAKRAYQHFYKQSLAQRIRGETSGDYEKLMVACTGP